MVSTKNRGDFTDLHITILIRIKFVGDLFLLHLIPKILAYKNIPYYEKTSVHTEISSNMIKDGVLQCTHGHVIS